jgi:hypothetical protein
MEVAFHQLTKLQTALCGFVLSSLVIGFLCISFVHTTPAHADMGAMNHSDQGVTLNGCCDTGVSDHMELWKSTLVGIPQGFQDVLVLIAFAISATFLFSDFFATPRLNPNLPFLQYKQYAREHPNIRVFDALRLAFAKGILNPKTH